MQIEPFQNPNLRVICFWYMLYFGIIYVCKRNTVDSFTGIQLVHYKLLNFETEQRKDKEKVCYVLGSFAPVCVASMLAERLIFI